MACQPPIPRIDDEVADVLLDVVGDAAEFGVEVGGAGDEGLGLGGDFRGGVGAVCFEGGDPLADGAPLVVFAIDGGVTPLDGHAGVEGGVFRAGTEVAQVKGGRVFELPAPVVGSDFNGLDGLEAVPGGGVGAARGKVNFESLEDDGDGALDAPDGFLLVGREQFFGLAEDGCADIGGGRVDDARFSVESMMGTARSPTSAKSESWAGYCFSSAPMVHSWK